MEGIITLSDTASRLSKIRVWELVIEFSNVQIISDLEWAVWVRWVKAWLECVIEDERRKWDREFFKMAKKMWVVEKKWWWFKKKQSIAREEDS